eukprot:3844488-Pyramimonas_sp.AAC.1
MPARFARLALGEVFIFRARSVGGPLRDPVHVRPLCSAPVRIRLPSAITGELTSRLLLDCVLILQILGNNECFEPYTSNIYARRVLSGEFTVVNQHLLHDMTELGLWSSSMKNMLIAANGSVANLQGIPDELKAIYKTVRANPFNANTGNANPCYAAAASTPGNKTKNPLYVLKNNNLTCCGL